MRKLRSLILVWSILKKSKKRKSKFMSSMKLQVRESLQLLTNTVIHAMKILLIMKRNLWDRLVLGLRMEYRELKVKSPIYKIIISRFKMVNLLSLDI